MSVENTSYPPGDAATAAHRDSLVLDYLIAVVGFGLCRGWIVFCLSAPIISFSTNWIYLLAGALTALIIAFIFHRYHSPGTSERVILYRATAAAIIISAVVIPFAFSQSSELLLLLGFIVGGIGAGLLQVLWGDRFACHEIRFATLVSPAAAVVTALLIALSTTEAGFVGFALFPLLSLALLVITADRTGLSYATLTRSPRNPATETQDPNNSAATPTAVPSLLSTESDTAAGEEKTARDRHLGIEVGKLMFSIMIFSFLCRTFDAMHTKEHDPFGFFGGCAIFALVVVGIAFLAIALILKERFNPTLTYRLSLPIMVAGFVAIALFFDTHAALSILLINVGYEFFDILSWVLFTEVSRRRKENPLHIFGLGVAFMFIGMSLGILVGTVVDSLLLSGEVQITVVAMLSILSLVFVAFLVIPEGTISQLTSAVRPDRKESTPPDELPEHADTAPAEATEGRIETNCGCVVDVFGLTPRESEVLVLLAYGRTLSIIARDLHIAKGTARTHIENIYRKLDVHKQQELIDLVEEFEAN